MTSDPLRSARRLVALLIGVTGTALVALALLIGGAGRRRAADCRALMRALSLSLPSWVPAGRYSRQPAALRRGVDLRHSPQLPLFDPSPERLLLPPAKPGEDHSQP